jgi:hypothetical protein
MVLKLCLDGAKWIAFACEKVRVSMFFFEKVSLSESLVVVWHEKLKRCGIWAL